MYIKSPLVTTPFSCKTRFNSAHFSRIFASEAYPENANTASVLGPSSTTCTRPDSGLGNDSREYARGITKYMEDSLPKFMTTGAVMLIFSSRSLPPKMYPATVRKPMLLMRSKELSGKSVLAKTMRLYARNSTSPSFRTTRYSGSSMELLRVMAHAPTAKTDTTTTTTATIMPCFMSLHLLDNSCGGG